MSIITFLLQTSFYHINKNTIVGLTWWRLQVSTDVDGKDTWKECFVVKGIRLPTNYYFGASATTGELAGQSCPPLTGTTHPVKRISYLFY